MVKIALFALCFMALLFPSFSNAGWEGKVIGVRDGGTIIVFDGKNPPVTVRLNGVTEAGADAKHFLAETTFGKMVKVENEIRGDDGGVSAEVIMPDGKSLNKELLRQGFTRHDGQKKDSAVSAAPLKALPPDQEAHQPVSEISGAGDSISNAQQYGEPPPVPGVRKWRDKRGNIHFSGTVGAKD
jgi:endonuclease YncB( thermonuclease family)